MGATKRQNTEEQESLLVYRTVRDMNLSRHSTIPLTLFPGMNPPPKGDYPKEEEILKTVVDKYGLVNHDDWPLTPTKKDDSDGKRMRLSNQSIRVMVRVVSALLINRLHCK